VTLNVESLDAERCMIDDLERKLVGIAIMELKVFSVKGAVGTRNGEYHIVRSQSGVFLDRDCYIIPKE
jgi:hypothetical protein